MTFATLCFVEKYKWRHFIEDAKEHTNPNGIHIIHMSLSGFPEDKWIYIRSFGIVDSPEYKELVVPTPLLIQPDRQGFSYANPADRNRSPNAELSNHFEFSFPPLRCRLRNIIPDINV